MKIRKSILRRTFFLSFYITLAIFFITISDAAQPKQLDLNCPPQTVQKGNQCVLEEDIVLDAPLELTSDTKLNCQGHTITPTSPGIENDGLVPRVPSVPEEGIRLDGSTGVKVQNCVMEDFDFGIVIQNENMTTDEPGVLALQRNKILANTITSLYQGVTVIDADNNQISGNTITHHSKGGVGISVQGDSDSNHINNNMVTGTATQNFAVHAPVVPGGADENFFRGDGIYLFSLTPGSIAKATGNIVEGNVVQPGGTLQVVGIVVGELQEGTIVRGNIVKNVVGGIFVGETKLVGSSPQFFWPTDVVVENNSVQDPFATGISFQTAVRPIARGNSITSTSTTGVPRGFLLRGPAFETAVVTRNNVSLSSGLVINLRRITNNGIAGDFYDAKIYLNDFRKGVIGTKIGRQDGYNFATEFSVDGQGNDWGKLCNDSNGFREFGEAGADSPATNIVDSNPYGEAVGVIVNVSGPCNMDSKTCIGNPAIGCATDANCIVYTERPEPPPPLTCPEQGF